ncbi:MAG: hypothetical protein ACYCQJ_11570 [Nitrososphaerales archaeon]
MSLHNGEARSGKTHEFNAMKARKEAGILFLARILSRFDLMENDGIVSKLARILTFFDIFYTAPRSKMTMSIGRSCSKMQNFCIFRIFPKAQAGPV